MSKTDEVQWAFMLLLLCKRRHESTCLGYDIMWNTSSVAILIPPYRTYMTYALNNENAEKESCVFDQHSNLYTGNIFWYILERISSYTSDNCLLVIFIAYQKLYICLCWYTSTNISNTFSTRGSLSGVSSPPLLLSSSSPLLIGYENSLAAEENPVKAISL